jgi:hypothetical protein
MYISESATQSQNATQCQPVGTCLFLWTADVSTNPNTETMQLFGLGSSLGKCLSKYVSFVVAFATRPFSYHNPITGITVMASDDSEF